jgi:hypothetical protein
MDHGFYAVFDMDISGSFVFVDWTRFSTGCICVFLISPLHLRLSMGSVIKDYGTGSLLPQWTTRVSWRDRYICSDSASWTHLYYLPLFTTHHIPIFAGSNDYLDLIRFTLWIYRHIRSTHSADKLLGIWNCIKRMDICHIGICNIQCHALNHQHLFYIHYFFMDGLLLSKIF